MLGAACFKGSHEMQQLEGLSPARAFLLIYLSLALGSNLQQCCTVPRRLANVCLGTAQPPQDIFSTEGLEPVFGTPLPSPFSLFEAMRVT